jgi:uncharacterized Rmd1/YagE family protein
MAQEQDVLKHLVVPCEVNPLPIREVEVDEFDVRYTANEKMHIQNDTITLNYRLSGTKENHLFVTEHGLLTAEGDRCEGFAGDHSIKLSISYALSQSTKLCVFEERVLEIVASTKDLPESLASTGNQMRHVCLSRLQVSEI